MKKYFFILLTLTLINCSTEDDSNYTEDNPEATILGRWVIPGLEDNIRIEFTATKRFDIYGSEGIFPTLETFNIENPLLIGLDWFYEGEKIIVDLNFGNFHEFIPQFVCDNNVVQLIDENDEIIRTYYREGFDYTTCN